MSILNADEACEFLKIARVTLYKHVRAGNIPAFRVGRALRFHKESLENWVKSKTLQDTEARSGGR